MILLVDRERQSGQQLCSQHRVRWLLAWGRPGKENPLWVCIGDNMALWLLPVHVLYPSVCKAASQLTGIPWMCRCVIGPRVNTGAHFTVTALLAYHRPRHPGYLYILVIFPPWLPFSSDEPHIGKGPPIQISHWHIFKNYSYMCMFNTAATLLMKPSGLPSLHSLHF